MVEVMTSGFAEFCALHGLDSCACLGMRGIIAQALQICIGSLCCGFEGDQGSHTCHPSEALMTLCSTTKQMSAAERNPKAVDAV